MKRLSYLFLIFTLSCVTSVFAQSSLPALRNNQESKQLIQDAVNELYKVYKTNPTLELEKKIVLFNKAVEILEEPTVKPASTEYALNSAFLFFEVNYNFVRTDSEALKRLNQKQWSTYFNDLVELVKL
ncbi:MAG: hypothetical protein HOP11_01670 [Saprospiraceae bacterium]|nr:hypothetical protein [Saprospiraceae bacterium]